MKKLHGPLDVKFINKSFFPQYSPDAINCGRCFLWAYIAHHMYAGAKLRCIQCHAFIEYDGKFYDSEVPHGFKDWTKLPATFNGHGHFSLEVQPLEKHTGKTFKRCWRSQFSRFNVKWESTHRKIRRLINEESRW